MSTDAGVTWEQIRQGVSEAVMERGEWAGAPVPVEGIPLVLEPRYPYQGLNGMYFGEHMHSGREHDWQGSNPDEDIEFINIWYSKKHNCDICIYRNKKTGKRDWAPLPCHDRYTMLLKTLGVSCTAWSLAAEAKAIESLSDKVSEHAMRCYILTGSFLESSPRSNVTYLFRRLRPTIAMSCSTGTSKVLATLCMHPIGFFEGTYAGCMVPTDEVIAHLLMMRSDEHKYWRMANQHQPGVPEAGL